ncbi:MAG: hypothetical protein GC179_23705 [Anaerolineaceae bacterium]|nr:hypothetical protein [Anaerolineaceae bacterium]
MTKLLLKLTIVVFGVIIFTCLTARAFGEQQAVKPAMRGFREGCQAAVDVCWYGITINQTPISEAINKLQGHSYFFVSDSTKPSAQNYEDKNLPCSVDFIYEYATVNGLVIQCHGLQVGDWINQFGVPDAVGQYHDVLYYNRKTEMRLKIQGALTPQSPIVEFILYVPRAFTEYGYDWRGFAPRWRYCQLNTFNPCT